MKFKRLLAILMLLSIFLMVVSPVYAAGAADTPAVEKAISKAGFRFNDKILSQIIEFTYNGEPFKTPDSYIRDATIPFVPLYYRTGRFLGMGNKYQILTLDRLLDDPFVAKDSAIYLDSGKGAYVKVSGLSDLSLDTSLGTFNSAVFNAQYDRYKDNLIKDNKGGIKDLIVGMDYYGNIVTNNKQIIIPFYNNPIVVNLYSGTMANSNDAIKPIGKLAQVLSPDAKENKEKKVSDLLTNKVINAEDVRHGYVLTAGMTDGNVLIKAVTNMEKYIQDQFYLKETVHDIKTKIKFYDKVKSPQIWDWQNFDVNLAGSVEKTRYAAVQDKLGKDITSVRTTTALADLAQCYFVSNKQANDNAIQTTDFCGNSELFKKADAKTITEKLKRDDTTAANSNKIMTEIYARYATSSLAISNILLAYIDGNANTLLYSYLPHNFGIDSAGKVTFDQMADKLKKQDGIIDMIYTYLSFGVWNLIKFTYTALGQELYTKVFLGHSGNSLFYTPTPGQFTFVSIATVSLYFVMAAICVFKMAFDLFRISFGSMTGKKYIISITKFILIFALPLLFYNTLVDATFNKTNQAFIHENLYQTAILDRAITYDREIITSAPGIGQSLKFRDPLENYAIQLPVRDQNGSFVQKTFGLFDFLDYTRNQALNYDKSPLTEEIRKLQESRGFASVGYTNSIIDFVSILSANDETKNFYQKYAKYKEATPDGSTAVGSGGGLAPGEKLTSDMFKEIYYNYVVSSMVTPGSDPIGTKFDVEKFYGTKIRDKIVNTISVSNFNYQAGSGISEKDIDAVLGMTPDAKAGIIKLNNNTYTQKVVNGLKDAKSLTIASDDKGKYTIKPESTITLDSLQTLIKNQVRLDYAAVNGGDASQSLKDISGITIVGDNIEVNNNQYTSNVIGKMESNGTIRILEQKADKFIITAGFNADGSISATPGELKSSIENTLKVNVNDATGYNIEQMMGIDKVLREAAKDDPFKLGATDYSECAKTIDYKCGILLNSYIHYLEKEGVVEISGTGFKFTGVTTEPERQAAVVKFKNTVADMNYKLIEDFRKYHLIFDGFKTRDDFMQAENEFLALNTFFYLNNHYSIDNAPKDFYTAGISTDTFLRILMIPMSKFSSTNTDINNVMVFVGMEYDPITFLIFLIVATIIFTAYSFIKIGVITIAFSFLITLASLQSVWYKKSRSYIGLIYIFGTFYLIHLGFLSLWKVFTMLNNRYHNFNNDYWIAAPELITSIAFLMYFVLVWKFVLIPMYKNIKSDIKNLGGAKVLADINKVWNKTKDWIKDRSQELKDRFKSGDDSEEGSDSETSNVNTKESDPNSEDENLQNGLKPQTSPPGVADPKLVEEINKMAGVEGGTGSPIPGVSPDGGITSPPVTDNGTILGDGIGAASMALGAGSAVSSAAKNIMDDLGYTVSEGDNGLLNVAGVSEGTLRDNFSNIATGLESKASEAEKQADNIKVDELSEGLNNDILKSAESAGMVTTETDSDGSMSYALKPGTTQEQFDDFYKNEVHKKVTGSEEVDNLSYDTDADGKTSFVKSPKTQYALDELEKSGLISGYEESNGRYNFTAAPNVSTEQIDSVLGGMNQLITTSGDPRFAEMNQQPSMDQISYISGDQSSLGGVLGELNNSERVTEIVKEAVGYNEGSSGSITLADNSVSNQVLESAGITGVTGSGGVITVQGGDATKLQEYMGNVDLDYRRTANENGDFTISSTDAVTKAVISEIAEQSSGNLRSYAQELRETAETLRNNPEDISVTPSTHSVSDSLLSHFSFNIEDSKLDGMRDILNGNRTAENNHYFDDVKAQLDEIGVKSADQLYKGDGGEYNIVTRLGARAEHIERTLREIQTPSIGGETFVPPVPGAAGLGANANLAGGNPPVPGTDPTGAPIPRTTVDTLARLAEDSRN